MIVLYKAEINHPCGHNTILKDITKGETHNIARMNEDREMRLCSKCYAEYCINNNVVPWYSR